MARKNSLVYDLQHSPVLDGIRKETADKYRKWLRSFASWCKDSGIKHLDDLEKRKPVELLREYSEHLQTTGYSASTIHTYLAAPCRVLKVNMKDVKKPVRCVAQNRRSRRFKVDTAHQGDKEENNPKYVRLVAFQRAVGIRRNELVKLTAENLKEDESGHLCVVVRRGKGGKRQLQRILPQYQEIVRKTFSEASEGRIFSKEEMSNHIDLHGMRADLAKEAYRYYTGRLRTDPDYRQILIEELKNRYSRYGTLENRRYNRFLDELKNTAPRKCRGENAELCKRLYGTDQLDRLAIMAVSVFHLSHWRADVTVSNYILSIREKPGVSSPGIPSS